MHKNLRVDNNCRLPTVSEGHNLTMQICRNSRLVVDEDHLMLLKKIKKVAMNW